MRRLLLSIALSLALCASTTVGAQNACQGRIFLSFDTGNMSQAQLIADTLRQQHIKASFFLANEKTTQGNFALDPAWADFWRTLAKDGHAFGSHTLHHTKILADVGKGSFQVKPEFGPQTGQALRWNAAQLCDEVHSVAGVFQQLTGRQLDPIWRAPGGKTTPGSLAAIAQCGYTHFGWAQAGFSGDELPSERFPNTVLLAKVLNGVKDGDIVMAHMGIWSRKDPWAPAVLPALIKGLQAKGFCFATLREHPSFNAQLRANLGSAK